MQMARRHGLRGMYSLGAAMAFFASVCISSPALSQQFGQNKVQYTNFQWRIFTTEHFDVHYYPEEREAALRGAQILERCYARLSTLLDHKFEAGKRKPVMLYATHAQFQETNIIDESVSEGTGGFTDMLRQRLVMPIPANYAEFEHVLCHELVHEFQFDIYSRRSDRYKKIKDSDIDISMWFMEGMAEYLSIGRVDPRTNATLRDATFSEYLNQLPDGYLAYRFGQALFSYVGSRYGDYAIGKILKRTMEVGATRGFSDNGINLQKLTTEWMAYANVTYTAQLFALEHPKTIGTLISNHEYPDIKRLDRAASFNSPALSPDGTKIVFMSERGNPLYGFDDYWLADARNGKIIRRIVEGGRTAQFESLRLLNSAPGWSYDATRLVFSSQYEGRDALYLYDFAAKKARRIELLDKTLTGAENPRFCGSDSRIVFTGARGGHRNLYIMDVGVAGDSKNLKELTNDPYADLHPVCSPDGKFVAFTSDRGSETDFAKTLTFSNMRVTLYEIATGAITVLPMQEEGENTNPVFSPDGKWVAFISDRTGIHNVFLWSLEQQRLYQLTNTITGVMGVTALSPALTWASKANVIVFTYFEKQGSNLYRIENPQSIAKLYDPATAARPAYPVVPLEKVYIPVPIRARRDSVCKAMTAQEKKKLSPDHPCSPSAKSGPKIDIFSDLSSEQLRAVLADSITIRTDSVLLISEGVPTIAKLREDPLAGLPDTASFIGRAYKSKLSLENVCGLSFMASFGGPYGFNMQGYGCAYWSDLMRDRRLITELAMFSSDVLNDSYLSVGYINLKHKVDRGFLFNQYPYYQYIGAGLSIAPDSSSYTSHYLSVRDVYRAGDFVLQRPLSPFQRLEGALTVGMISRTLIDQAFTYQGYNLIDYSRDKTSLQTNKFVGASGAYVSDNALPAFVDYVDGKRMRVGFRQLVGGLQVTELSADVRKYSNIGGRWAVASRLFSINRMGRDASRFVTYWGYDSFIRGYGSSAFDLTCAQSGASDPLKYPGGRCTPQDGSVNLIGSSALFGSLELRGPLVNPVDTKTSGAIPPLGFALFVDAGSAYNSLSKFQSPMVSYGAEIRTRFAGMSLRFGYALTPTRTDSKRGFYFSFMPSF